jgi:putative ubiquitin-RnfH superfamily antitoxin RatB of RatAB toxin-antitoxin module
MSSIERIGVTVIFAESARAISRQYSLAQGSTVEDALTLAVADPEFAGVDMAQLPVGIFGRVVQRNQPLQQGDRVELYRPLAEDPKTARRQRARSARAG